MTEQYFAFIAGTCFGTFVTVLLILRRLNEIIELLKNRKR